MKRFSVTKIVLILLFVLMFQSVTAAEIPKLIAFQGRLSDTQGLPLTGNYNFTFRLYNVATGGAAIWTENQNSIAVNNGIYNVYLGDVTSLGSLSFDTQYWISVEVNGDGEMTPRRRLTATGYAMRAEVADTAVNIADSAKAYGSFTIADTLQVGDSFIVENNGNVGIGTTNPSYALDVTGDVRISGNVYGETYPGMFQNIAGDSVTAVTTINFTGLSPGKLYRVTYRLVKPTAGKTYIRFNNDSGNNYSWMVDNLGHAAGALTIYSSGGADVVLELQNDGGGVNLVGEFTFTTQPDDDKRVLVYGGGVTICGTGSSGIEAYRSSGRYIGAAALSSMQMLFGSSATVTGQVYLYESGQ